jgi:hypothetical protein
MVVETYYGIIGKPMAVAAGLEGEVRLVHSGYPCERRWSEVLEDK